MAVALFCCAAGYSLAQSQQPPVGIIRSISGNWTLQGSSQALGLEHVLRKGEIPSIARSTEGSLVVGLFSQAKAWEVHCTPAAPCEGPYKLPEVKAPSGFWAYIVSYVGGDAPKKPPAIFAGSRDAQQGPQHAVIAISGGSMQLDSPLAQFPAGQYRLSFTPLGATAGNPTRVDLAWNGTSASIPAVPPGFYALDAYSSDGEHIGSHAALLVVPADDTVSQQRWQEALPAIQDAAGPDAALADKLRLSTVLALRDREQR